MDQPHDDWTDSGWTLDGWISTSTTRTRSTHSTTAATHRTTTAAIRRQWNAAPHDDGDAASPARRADDTQSLSRGVRPPVGDTTRSGSGNLEDNYFRTTDGDRGGVLTPALDPKSVPTSTTRMLEADSDNDMVSKFDQQLEVGPGHHHHDQPDTIDPSVMLDSHSEDRGWGISMTEDDIKIDFETRLRGLIVWFAMVAWPSILLSFLCNLILLLLLLCFVCSCCKNRSKYRKLKSQLYIRVPTLIPSSYSLPATTTVKDEAGAGQTMAKPSNLRPSGPSLTM